MPQRLLPATKKLVIPEFCLIVRVEPTPLVGSAKVVLVVDQAVPVVRYPCAYEPVAAEVGAVDCQVVPLLVRTFPLVLGATKVGEEVPFPKMTLLAVRAVRPVPPSATGTVPLEMYTASQPVFNVGVAMLATTRNIVLLAIT